LRLLKCFTSPYGRTVYTKFLYDLHIFVSIPHGTDECKPKMKTRTSIERVNKRIPVDFGLEEAHTKGKKHINW